MCDPHASAPQGLGLAAGETHLRSGGVINARSRVTGHLLSCALALSSCGGALTGTRVRSTNGPLMADLPPILSPCAEFQSGRVGFSEICKL
jgi:hypothetical protein